MSKLEIFLCPGTKETEEARPPAVIGAPFTWGRRFPQLGERSAPAYKHPTNPKNDQTPPGFSAGGGGIRLTSPPSC